MNELKNKLLVVRIPGEVKIKLEKHAAQEGRTLSHLVRRILEAHIHHESPGGPREGAIAK